MTLTDIKNKKNKLSLIYKTVEKDLEKRTDWQSYNSNKWSLRYVGIRNDGELFAEIGWDNGKSFDERQTLGISWENVFNDANIDSL